MKVFILVILGLVFAGVVLFLVGGSIGGTPGNSLHDDGKAVIVEQVDRVNENPPGSGSSKTFKPVFGRVDQEVPGQPAAHIPEEVFGRSDEEVLAEIQRVMPEAVMSDPDVDVMKLMNARKISAEEREAFDKEFSRSVE